MTTINLGGLAKAAPKSAKKEKPILPDPTGELTALIPMAIANQQTVDAHTGALNQHKATLAAAAFAHACRFYAGRSANIEDTFQIGTASGKAVVSLTNRYKLPKDDLDSVRAVLGVHSGFLKETFSISIDATAIPEFVLQSFVDELVKVARGFDAMIGIPEGEAGPVFQAITIKPEATIDKAFHEARYGLFSAEDNARIHAVMPCTISTRLDY